MRTTKPEAGNKYYITTSKGGWSRCIEGNPTDFECNVLANCVGYACGRFNEIIGSMKYPYFNCNAEDFITRAKAYYPELQIETDVNKGSVGDIIVWLGAGSYAGHVAIIEKVNSAASYYTSESSWDGSAFFNATRTNSNGRLGMSSSYTFLGFIKQPSSVTPPEETPEEEKKTDSTGYYLIKKGDTLSKIAKSYSTTTTYLMKINPQITDKNKIYAGDTINVPVREETKEPVIEDKTLKVGDKVKIVKTGNGSSYGTGSVAYGIGWTRFVKHIWVGKEYPYQIGNESGTTGFYKEDAIEKII